MWFTDCSCMVVTCLSHAHVHYLDTSLDTVHWLFPVFWDHRGQSVEGLLHLPPSFSQERSKGESPMMCHHDSQAILENITSLLPSVLLITSAKGSKRVIYVFNIAWCYGVYHVNFWFYCTFRHSTCDLRCLVQILTLLVVLIQILGWLVVNNMPFYKLHTAARLPHWLPHIRVS